MDALKQAMASAAVDVEATLRRVMASEDEPERRLFNSMRYAALGGGKRLRPFLVLQAAGLFSVARKSALRTAAAIELVHCYSLAHDDLPVMDNDDLRRGKPTLHKAFDEATAILAGDALLTFAFELLAETDTHSNPEVRCRLVLELARAAGAHGMVAGQMIDLSAAGRDMDIGEITRLQRLKTGALIGFACGAGAILGQAAEAQHEALRGYAHDLGLAFQIADDLLDVEGTEAEVGKAVGKDAGQGKATFVSILGPERAHGQAIMLVEQASAHLAIFDEKADFLRNVAQYIVERRS